VSALAVTATQSAKPAITCSYTFNTVSALTTLFYPGKCTDSSGTYTNGCADATHALIYYCFNNKCGGYTAQKCASGYECKNSQCVKVSAPKCEYVDVNANGWAYSAGYCKDASGTHTNTCEGNAIRKYYCKEDDTCTSYLTGPCPDGYECQDGMKCVKSKAPVASAGEGTQKTPTTSAKTTTTPSVTATATTSAAKQGGHEVTAVEPVVTPPAQPAATAAPAAATTTPTTSTAATTPTTRPQAAAVPTPAKFSLSGLSVTPAQVKIGEKVTISVQVANTGDISGTYDVNLKINNVVTDSKSVTLAGKSSQTVTFTTSKNFLDTYNVVAIEEGSNPGTFLTLGVLVSCHKYPLGHAGYCSNTCKCGVGEGDCNGGFLGLRSTAQCNEGLYCASNMGTKYGLPPGVNVCVPMPSAAPPVPPAVQCAAGISITADKELYLPGETAVFTIVMHGSDGTIVKGGVALGITPSPQGESKFSKSFPATDSGQIVVEVPLKAETYSPDYYVAHVSSENADNSCSPAVTNNVLFRVQSKTTP